MVKNSIYLILFLFISGCAGNNAGTLRGLSDRDIVIEKSEIEPVASKKIRDNYHRYIDSASNNHPKYNEALSRLANLEMNAGDEALFDNPVKKPSKGNGKKSAEEKNYQIAIEMYETLLKSNPKDKRNDSILYQLARAYEQMERVDKSLKALNQLVIRFPNSSFFLEAQFRRGEINFLQKNYKRAEKAYSVVLRRGKKSEYYDRSIYKYGWSLLKQEKFDNALTTFFKILDGFPIVYDEMDVIDYQALSNVEREMLDDIFRAVNLCVTYGGGANYIEKILKKRKRQAFEYELLTRLGDYFLSRDRTKDAADAYGLFTLRHRNHPMSASMHLKRIAVFDSGRFQRSAFKARKNFVTRYGVGSLYWNQQTRHSKENLKADIEKITNEILSYYHSRYQKTRREGFYINAVRWYQTYIKMFQGEPSAAEKEFLLGELFNEKRRYQKAAVAYENAAYMYPDHAHSRDAAYALIDVHNRIKKTKNKPEKSSVESKRIEVGLKFIEKYPDDEMANTIRMNIMEEYFKQKNSVEAVKHATLLLKQPNANRRQKMSANIIIGHAAFDREDYLLSESHYQAALRLGIKNKKLKNTVNDRLVAGVYKHAEALRTQADLAGAVASFARVAKMTGDRKLAMQARYDIATLYITHEQWDLAIASLTKFRKIYPKNPYRIGVAEKLAVAYKKVDKKSLAASEILFLGKVSNNSEKNIAAQWEAAALYEEDKNIKKAIASYKKLARKHNQNSEEAYESKQKLVDLYAGSQQWKKRDYWLRNILTTYRKTKKVSDRSKYIVANASISQANKQFSSYRDVKLKLPLKRSLKQKRRLMDKAIKAYESVANIGVAEFSTASTFYVAQIYQQFGDDIMTSQRPKKLSSEEREEYDLLLEEQAYPFEEQAIGIYEANIGRMRQGIYNDWIRKSVQKLAKLQPARYDKPEALVESYANLD